MSMVPWLRRRVLATNSLRRTTLQRPSTKRRPEFIQLEDRLVPATSVTASVVDPPTTFFEGVAVNLTNTVQGAVGALTYDWTVTKDGAAFASGATADFSFTPDDNAAYAVSLSVTDAGDASVVSDNSIAITVENQAPVAGVSGPTTGDLGASLAFTHGYRCRS